MQIVEEHHITKIQSPVDTLYPALIANTSTNRKLQFSQISNEKASFLSQKTLFMKNQLYLKKEVNISKK